MKNIINIALIKNYCFKDKCFTRMLSQECFHGGVYYCGDGIGDGAKQ